MSTVWVRSFIIPPDRGETFSPGVPFTIDIPENLTLGQLANRILSKNIEQLGIMAVNGRIGCENPILSEGDKIDLFAFVDGG
jgi:sulfur carrier protein ThiS